VPRTRAYHRKSRSSDPPAVIVTNNLWWPKIFRSRLERHHFYWNEAIADLQCDPAPAPSSVYLKGTESRDCRPLFFATFNPAYAPD
jgi:hypothetical protein